MSIATPVALDRTLVPDNVSLFTWLALEIKATSSGADTPASDPESEDVDGCEVAVEHATSDEDLPVTEGGEA